MNIFITAITSEIGFNICKHYLEEGHNVIGTYRNLPSKALENQLDCMKVHLIYCDFEDEKSIDTAIIDFIGLNIKWDVWISAVGVIAPIERFEEVNSDLWEKNIYVNALSQMRMLKGMLPCRSGGSICIFHDIWRD